jgi:hypothetical protein
LVLFEAGLMKFTVVLFAVIAVLLPLFAVAQFDNGRVGFTIAFEGLESDLSILTTAIMPGQRLHITTSADAAANMGQLSKQGNGWIWVAPAKPERAELDFTIGAESIRLNVFVLTPFKNGETESLNGYRVGHYATTLFKGLETYSVPQGFIDFAKGPEDLKISPHFTLKQFLCKQQPGHDPTYLLVRTAMLIKLEALLDAANAKGWRADSFYVMSGFRTPFYNRSIGNDTSSSRHLYGGAADIWLDNDGDGQMDDLNQDGKINKDDARALAALAGTLADKGGRNWPAGGIGVYGANSAHGPFLHIDARGYRARW